MDSGVSMHRVNFYSSSKEILSIYFVSDPAVDSSNTMIKKIDQVVAMDLH